MGYFNRKGIDKDAYIMLIEEYRETMYRIAYGYLGNETEALESIDEAIYLGYAKRKTVKEPEFAKTWLTRILINECYRILKKSKHVSFYEFPPDLADEREEPISLNTKLALQSLPEDLRQVIILRYFADMTISETAEFLSIPDGTVSSKARKALSILRIELMDEEGAKIYEKES